MPLKNRVDPFGDLVSVSARGQFMGNRGCLHDNSGNIVRRSEHERWITCVTEWPGEKRPLLAPKQYTPLFFHDEATAFAAGHRPCAQCRRPAFNHFKAAWAKALGIGTPISAMTIDNILSSERGLLVPASEPELLPVGAMVCDSSRKVWLRQTQDWAEWSFEGYGPSTISPDGPLFLVTPPSTVAAFRAGYLPQL